VELRERLRNLIGGAPMSHRARVALYLVGLLVVGGVYAATGSGAAQFGAVVALLLVGRPLARSLLGSDAETCEPTGPSPLAPLWVAPVLVFLAAADLVFDPDVFGPWFSGWLVVLPWLELLRAVRTWSGSRYPGGRLHLGSLGNALVTGVGGAVAVFLYLLVQGTGVHTALIRAGAVAVVLSVVLLVVDLAFIPFERRRAS
jgi:hypothetical protein